ncbi:MAG: glycosyltransferase family 2 protein, partial [Gammaproteobacteria bacterium]
RAGQGIGGGEDAALFKALVARAIKIRYRPDMIINHLVEPWKIRRSYFLKLHFLAGRKFGQHGAGEYGRTLMGVPPFMLVQAVRHGLKALAMILKGKPGVLRQAMNGAHAVGCIWGRMLRWKSDAKL